MVKSPSARAAALLLPLALLLTSLGPRAYAAGRPKAEPAAAAPKPAVDPVLFSGLKWREVGPFRGGRVAAVTGVPGDRNTYYFGATGGGVWKSTDAGRTWKNVSDGFFGGSIGAVAVSESGPQRRLRRRRRGDGARQRLARRRACGSRPTPGKTWKHSGSTDARQIARIRIHPKDPDLVYVAVLGHVFGPNEMRGVYRSKDGGEPLGARAVRQRPGRAPSTSRMDPTNPRILYASMWQLPPHPLQPGERRSRVGDLEVDRRRRHTGAS